MDHASDLGRTSGSLRLCATYQHPKWLSVPSNLPEVNLYCEHQPYCRPPVAVMAAVAPVVIVASAVAVALSLHLSWSLSLSFVCVFVFVIATVIAFVFVLVVLSL